MTNSYYQPIKFYKRFHKGVTTCFFYWSDRISTLLAIVWDREYVLSIATCRLIKPLLCFDGHSFLLLLLWWCLLLQQLSFHLSLANSIGNLCFWIVLQYPQNVLRRIWFLGAILMLSNRQHQHTRSCMFSCCLLSFFPS